MYQATTFQYDVTPPLGHPLCAGWYPPAVAIKDPLSAFGFIIVPPNEAPIVLCALDWAELSNLEHLRWRQDLASAVKTEADRVAVHTIHGHDTPWPDREAQDILDTYGYPNEIMAGDWCERVRAQIAAAAASAMDKLQPCSHITTGKAKVEKIASNRRVMGEDGKVWAVRWTRTTDPQVRAKPEGVIDPILKTIGFWNADKPIAALHYYAVHPTSYDRTGEVTSDFAGLARDRRITEDGNIPHIYFTGCAGNVTPGKYNDGNIRNREIFTTRLYDAIKSSEQSAQRQPLTSLRWQVEPVYLPPREDMLEQDLRALIKSADVKVKVKTRAALQLAYLQRLETPIAVSCLHLNRDVAILNLPGEAFIEYQLIAQELRPKAFVAVASYGDLGTGYITLERSFAEGGYEPKDAFVSGQAEKILRSAIEKVIAAICKASASSSHVVRG
jgi:hypothetical protein